MQPDVLIRHSAYGVGYPQVNSIVSFGEDSTIRPDTNHYLVAELYLADEIEFHERAHCTFVQPSYYEGEIEAIVNFPYAYVSIIHAWYEVFDFIRLLTMFEPLAGHECFGGARLRLCF